MGVSANDDAAGLSGVPLGVDAIEQFQVVTSGGQAELGRALGGYINVVTRSGTNTRHGTVYGFFRDDAFNGKNALTGTKLPMEQQQFGASLGGPLVRNRTFYFANVERKLLDQTGVTTITAENAVAINARLAEVAYQGLPVTTGIYPNPVHSTNVLGKVDHQLSRADQMSVRYAFYDVVSSNARGAGTLNAPSASTGIDNIDQSLAVGNVWTLSSNTINETRVQVAHGDLEAYSTDQVGPQVTITGVATFGTFSSSPTRRENTMVQVVNSLSHRAGAHALRAGIDFLYNNDTITFLRTFRGSYSFSSLANFQTGTYNGYCADVRQSGRHPDQPQCRRLHPGRMARRLTTDAEPRAALRPAVSRDDQHGRQQHLAAARLRLDAGRFPASGRPRRGRAVLRPRTAARRRQRLAVRRQHHRRQPTAPAAGVRPVTDASRRSRFPEHPA